MPSHKATLFTKWGRETLNQEKRLEEFERKWRRRKKTIRIIIIEAKKIVKEEVRRGFYRRRTMIPRTRNNIMTTQRLTTL